MASSAALDPYYFQRSLQNLEAQRMSTGQSKGFTPEQLNQMIYANFSAQQERETTEKKLALEERAQTLNEQNAADARKQAQLGNIVGGISGLTQIGLNLPGAIKGYQDIGWMKKPGTTPAFTPTTGQTMPGYSPTTGTTGITGTDQKAMALTPDLAASALPGFAPIADTIPGFSPLTGATGVGSEQAAITGAAGDFSMASTLAPVAGGLGAYALGQKMGLTDTQAALLGAAGIGLSIVAPWAGAAILGADVVSGWF